MTNLEGRVILRERALTPPDGVLTDLEILCRLGQLLGRREQFCFTSARAVFEELRRATAGGIADYSGITYEKIKAQQGVFWPCPSEEHEGTPRLFQDGFFPAADGRARFHAVHYEPPAEEPSVAWPLYLTTGRLLNHYQSGTQTRRVARLMEMAAEPFAELHPATARRYGISSGDKVWIETKRDAASFAVRLTSQIREDTIFVPFHWGGAQSINRLVNDALDPVSRMPEFKVCAARISRAVES
jgi:assimilatory nitrate reductase catalytic subunit